MKKINEKYNREVEAKNRRPELVWDLLHRLGLKTPETAAIYTPAHEALLMQSKHFDLTNEEAFQFDGFAINQGVSKEDIEQFIAYQLDLAERYAQGYAQGYKFGLEDGTNPPQSVRAA